ncbi:oxidative damage protection protein [Pseudomonadota bacterium]
MTRMVNCTKLNEELAGLERIPYPGELGQRIYDNISKQAWQMWLQQQTMLINEYRLALIDPKAQTFLKEEMEKFLFGGGEAFVPPQQ